VEILQRQNFRAKIKKINTKMTLLKTQNIQYSTRTLTFIYFVSLSATCGNNVQSVECGQYAVCIVEEKVEAPFFFYKC